MAGEAEALRRQGRGYTLATVSSREDHGGPDSVRGVEVAVEPEAANARGEWCRCALLLGPNYEGLVVLVRIGLCVWGAKIYWVERVSMR